MQARLEDLGKTFEEFEDDYAGDAAVEVPFTGVDDVTAATGGREVAPYARSSSELVRGSDAVDADIVPPAYGRTVEDDSPLGEVDDFDWEVDGVPDSELGADDLQPESRGVSSGAVALREVTVVPAEQTVPTDQDNTTATPPARRDPNSSDSTPSAEEPAPEPPTTGAGGGGAKPPKEPHDVPGAPLPDKGHEPENSDEPEQPTPEDSEPAAPEPAKIRQPGDETDKTLSEELGPVPPEVAAAQEAREQQLDKLERTAPPTDIRVDAGESREGVPPTPDAGKTSAAAEYGLPEPPPTLADRLTFAGQVMNDALFTHYGDNPATTASGEPIHTPMVTEEIRGILENANVGPNVKVAVIGAYDSRIGVAVSMAGGEAFTYEPDPVWHQQATESLNELVAHGALTPEERGRIHALPRMPHESHADIVYIDLTNRPEGYAERAINAITSHCKVGARVVVRGELPQDLQNPTVLAPIDSPLIPSAQQPIEMYDILRSTSKRMFD